MLDMTSVTPSNPFPPLSDKLAFRVRTRPNGWFNQRTGEWIENPEYKTIVREAAGGGRALANVGKNYKLLLNTDLFPHVEKHMTDVIAPEFLTDVTVKEHTSYGGRDCWREYIFNSLKCDIGKQGDVAFRMIVGNSYGAKAVTLLYGAIDFYCTNGMVIGQSDKQARKHTSGLHVSGLDQWITEGVKVFASHGARIQEYTETHIDLTKEDALFSYLVSKNLLSELRARNAQEAMHKERVARQGHGARPTLWHLYSSLTDWATHDDVRDTGNDHEANTRIQRQQHAERVIRAARDFVLA